MKRGNEAMTKAIDLTVWVNKVLAERDPIAKKAAMIEMIACSGLCTGCARVFLVYSMLTGSVFALIFRFTRARFHIVDTFVQIHLPNAGADSLTNRTGFDTIGFFQCLFWRFWLHCV